MMKTAAMMGTTFPQQPGGSMEDTMVQLEGQLNTKNAFETATGCGLWSGGSHGQKFTFLYEAVAKEL